MFKNLEALTKEKHQDLRFSTIRHFGFAEKISTAPLCLSEFAVASKYYPIVFLKDAGMPAVILSFEKDKNGFITPEGTWKVPYVPAHFRKYPFTLAKVDNTASGSDKPNAAASGSNAAAPGSDAAAPGSNAAAPGPDAAGTEKEAPADQNQDQNKNQNFVLCIDRDASQFAAAQGDLMFTANGDFTELVSKQVEFLKMLQNEINTTSNLVKIMDEKGILTDRNFLLNVNGKTVPVGGFRVVDMKRVAELDDALLADWVRKGVISLITSHMNSLAGISMGPVDGA